MPAGNPEAIDAKQPLIGQNYENLLARANQMNVPGDVLPEAIDGFATLVKWLIEQANKALEWRHMESPHMENALANAWAYAQHNDFSAESLEELRQPFRDLGEHLDRCPDGARGGISRFEAQMHVLLAGGDLGRLPEASKPLFKVNALELTFKSSEVGESIEARVLMQQILAKAKLPNADWAPPAIEAAFGYFAVTVLDAIGWDMIKKGIADPAIDTGIRDLFWRELAAIRGNEADAYVPGAVRGLSYMYDKYAKIANLNGFKTFFLSDEGRVEVLVDDNDFRQRPVCEMYGDGATPELKALLDDYLELAGKNIPGLQNIFGGIGFGEVPSEGDDYDAAIETLRELGIDGHQLTDLSEKLNLVLSATGEADMEAQYVKQWLDEIMPPQAE